MRETNNEIVTFEDFKARLKQINPDVLPFVAHTTNEVFESDKDVREWKQMIEQQKQKAIAGKARSRLRPATRLRVPPSTQGEPYVTGLEAKPQERLQGFVP